MEYWLVEVRGDGVDHCKTFQEYEWDSAMSYFFEQRRRDRHVSLHHYGEEWEEE